ncbi:MULTISPECIES: tetratricopeptide repeat protein [unclassified Pseudomonas]|uniref:tetratricopeptide repeat protein n=1 Tax=unclassified Pseudomonas TaxID=196821 RepID=UPI001B337D9F|nr:MULTISPECIES: tetratricopeptide repeat protein [unclassified Pseudomonas]MBP5943944.1 tetratricopeptide repeat protein [Pseudomonas sp. P9(2020)]MBZ9563027.1 tetratricopeptide repeat protein [Pseudomonas sp. P116]
MVNKFHAFFVVGVLATSPCRAEGEPVVVNGVDGTSVRFSGWDKLRSGWNSVEYKGVNDNFSIYSLPTKSTPSGISTLISLENVSPDKRKMLLLRVVSGEVSDGHGYSEQSEQAYCDAVSLETGCVENIGSALQCDGSWVGAVWKDSTGEVYDFVKSSFPPKSMIDQVSRISSVELRANSIKDLMFMGIPSYMACNPPKSNVAAYNDIGFYFAEGGENLLATQVYERLLPLAPDRVPLKLNMADSLWALGKHNEAKNYYVEYRSVMAKKGLSGKIPARVGERLDPNK